VLGDYFSALSGSQGRRPRHPQPLQITQDLKRRRQLRLEWTFSARNGQWFIRPARSGNQIRGRAVGHAGAAGVNSVTAAVNGMAWVTTAPHVWEWCWDWFDETYYARSPLANPQGYGTRQRADGIPLGGMAQRVSSHGASNTGPWHAQRTSRCPVGCDR